MRHGGTTATLGLLIVTLLFAASSVAGPVPVRRLEGVTFGFLVLKNLDGKIIGHGLLKQVAKPGTPVITDDLQFKFQDGSTYDEITKFTQHGVFRLITDQVTQKGPSFKHDSESWVDARTGKVTVRSVDQGKEKQTTKMLKLPPDLANGLLFILVKNIDPSAETDVSMVGGLDKPRIAKLQFLPQPEKTVSFGPLTLKAQHYLMKVKIEGVAGVVAPALGKQPPDAQFWTIKSEAPTFLEYEGPLSEDGPVLRVELAAPNRDSKDEKGGDVEPK